MLPNMKECEMVTPVREFWNRKVDKTIQMFEYGAYTNEKFLSEMTRLGFDKATIKEAIDDV
tara:strand:- start:191 stop:373 length:183 start_codon:yes stop_codon:yes gene_type:complete